MSFCWMPCNLWRLSPSMTENRIKWSSFARKCCSFSGFSPTLSLRNTTVKAICTGEGKRQAVVLIQCECSAFGVPFDSVINLSKLQSCQMNGNITIVVSPRRFQPLVPSEDPDRLPLPFVSYGIPHFAKHPGVGCPRPGITVLVDETDHLTLHTTEPADQLIWLVTVKP